MREFTLWILKIMALALGIAGWVTYFMLWFGVRIHGSLDLSFGVWGPSWVKWFETWIEPLVLLAIVAVITWALFRQLTDGVPSISRSSTTDAELADTVPGVARRSLRSEEATEIIPGIPRHERLFPLFSPTRERQGASDDTS